MEWTGLSENLREQDDESRHCVQGYSDAANRGLSGEGTGDSLTATIITIPMQSIRSYSDLKPYQG